MIFGRGSVPGSQRLVSPAADDLDFGESSLRVGECCGSNIFSFGAALVAKEVCAGGDHHREKGHNSGQDRKGSAVHPGPSDRGKSLRPDRRIAQ